MSDAIDPAAFSANLRRLRESRGLTLRKLAEMVQINHAALSRMESGRCTPSFGVLMKLHKALGVSLDELCGSS